MVTLDGNRKCLQHVYTKSQFRRTSVYDADITTERNLKCVCVCGSLVDFNLNNLTGLTITEVKPNKLRFRFLVDFNFPYIVYASTFLNVSRILFDLFAKSFSSELLLFMLNWFPFIFFF